MLIKTFKLQSNFSHLLFLTISILLLKQNLLGINAQTDVKQDQPLLFCQPNKMFINITKSYLRKHNIEIKSNTQLYFRGHEGCFAQEENNAYILSLFNPFTACGTSLDHTTEDYIYTNEVVLDRRDGNGATKLLEMRCVYEDKYIVSSGPMTPTKNTLTFTTEYGEFETKMTLYENSRFDSMAKLDDRPSIQLGDPVYVSVSMFIPFNPEYNNDFTITIKSCFANNDPSHTLMDTYHYLISGMCASPDDKTVTIFQNGEESQTEARFAFDMFKFRTGFDYFYVHCEVKLCNVTAEVCNGKANGEKCFGKNRDDEENGGSSQRSKRDTYDAYYFSDRELEKSNRNHVGNLARQKRATEEEMPDPEDETLAYLSRGPLILATASKEAVDSKSGITNIVFEDSRREQSFLRLWVFSGIAAVIGTIGIILTGITIYTRRAERIKLQSTGTVITAPTITAAKNNSQNNQWRQGPLPQIPKEVSQEGSDKSDIPDD